MDYTKLPVGQKIEDGQIEKCPHCGRNGLAAKVEGKNFYTHIEAVRMQNMDNAAITLDFCPAFQRKPSKEQPL
jgi:hypothetical protein